MRERATASELLDGEVDDLRLLADSFGEVWGVNRYLGGMAVLKRHLAPWMGRWHISLLDVAAGTGDVAAALAAWARSRGASLQVTLLDNHPQVTGLARQRAASLPAFSVVDGDACRLPFADGEFDLAICNLALHHLEPGAAKLALREMDRVSRLGWVVTDLERHVLAHAAAQVMARSVWRNPITRHDGPLSVRRSYRAPEVKDMLWQAGLHARVHRHFPFRWAAVCCKGR
jgi:ubiquinone/menaquinone biosynthesis C-methylase UbiE